MKIRIAVSVLMVAASMAACNKTDKTADQAPSGTAATPSAKPSAAPSAAPVNDGHVVKAADLMNNYPPRPKGAPADGIWSQADTVEDGYFFVNYIKGKDGWMSYTLIDCNGPKAQKYAKDPDLGQFAYCFTKKPDSKVKGFPMFADGSSQRVVILKDHIVIIVGAWMDTKTGKFKYTTAEIEEFLGTVDLDAISKL